MRSIEQRCPHCAAIVGRLIKKANVVYLDTGEWLILDGKRHCHVCGSVFVFKPPKVSFEALLKRAEAEKGGLVIS